MHQYTHLLNMLSQNQCDEQAKSEMNTFLVEWYDTWYDPDFKKIFTEITHSEYYRRLNNLSFNNLKKYMKHMPLSCLLINWVKFIKPQVIAERKTTTKLEYVINHVNNLWHRKHDNTINVDCTLPSTDNSKSYLKSICFPVELVQLANEVTSFKATIIAFFYLIHGFAMQEEQKIATAKESLNLKFKTFSDTLSAEERIFLQQ